MRPKLVLLAGICVLLSGCGRRGASTYEGIVMDTIVVDVEKRTQRNVRDYFSQLEIIPLETSRESAIQHINRIIVDDDFLYVFDGMRNAVLIFDREGYFVQKIEQKGRGPGEYIGLMDISLNRNTGHLSFLTDIPEKIMRYDPNGRFVDDEETPLLFMGIANDNGRDILFNTEKQSRSEDNNHLWFRNGTGYIKKVPIVQTNNNFVYAPLIIESRHLLFTPRYENVIMRVEGEGAVPSYYVDFGSHWLSDRQFEEWEQMGRQDGEYFSRESRQKKIVHSIVMIRETDNHLVFKTNLFGFVLYDKRTGTADYLMELQDDEVGFKALNYFAHDGDDGKMMFVESPNNIRNIALHTEGDENSYNRRCLLEIASTIEEDANPVLLFYTFK